MQHLEKDFQQKVFAIARQAGQAIMEIYTLEERGVETKADHSPITLADKKANDIISSQLQTLTPSIPIISEELPLPPFEVRQHYAYYWLIDPLDGTKEFVQRNGEFTVNIALIHHNRPVFGVVFLPVEATLYWAAEGIGAWKIHNEQENLTPLQADTFTLSQSGLAIAVSRSHFNQATSNYIGQFTFPRLIAKGSALKMLYVAEGKVHIHPRFGTTMEWDTAAAQIIVEEAGGKVLKLEDNTPLTYNKENLKNPDYVVYGKVRL